MKFRSKYFIPQALITVPFVIVAFLTTLVCVFVVFPIDAGIRAGRLVFDELFEDKE